MNSKRIILIVVLAVAAAAGAFWYYKQSVAPIEYAPISRDCMSTEFVKGYQEDISADYYTRKDSCAFSLTYEDPDEDSAYFASLNLSSPLSATFNSCGTGKDVRDHGKDILVGNVVDEQAMTLDGKSAYKVITEDSGYNFITVFICLGSKTYKSVGLQTSALYVTGLYEDDFQIEAVDHALANWQWK